MYHSSAVLSARGHECTNMNSNGLLELVVQMRSFSELHQDIKHCFPALLLLCALCYTQVSLDFLQRIS